MLTNALRHIPRPLFLTLALASIGAVSSYGATASARAAGAALGEGSLVSHWKGDGDATDTLAASHGVPVGTVNFEPGASGQAFSLAGAGYIEVPNPKHSNYANGFTVSAWIRIASESQTAPVLNYRTRANDMGFSLEQKSGVPGALMFAVNQSGIAEDFKFVLSEGWATDTLYHVAATFDAGTGTIVLYRDGKAVAGASDLPRAPIATKSSPQLQIGHNIVSDAYWNGLIDDVRYYGRALTAAEVSALGTASSLVAHWTFDELEGTVAHDTTGAFPGTLSGGASFVSGGISGNAVSLAEATSSLVNMGTSFPGFTSGDFSIVLWVNTTTTKSNSCVLSKHEGGSFNGYIVNMNRMGSIDDYGVPEKAVFYTSAAPGQELTSTTSVTNGAWHQIVSVYRAGGASAIYVDGAPAELTKNAPALVGNGAPLLIGGAQSGGSLVSNYTGLVDDVQVYSSALSDAQIQYLFQNPGRVAPLAMYDLRGDWSDASNPEGPWRLLEGANTLPHVNAWANAFGEFTSPQPAWARSEGGNTYLPAWYKCASAPTNPNVFDLQVGDVVVHTTDDANGIGSGAASVVWTSPVSGTVDVSGAVWMCRDIGRSNDWFLYHNSTLLTQGNVASGDAYNRATPMPLSAGSGGAEVLRDLEVAAGDTIRLELVNSSTYGDNVGVNLAVSIPIPEADSVVSYFLPKLVKLKILGAGKDTLTVAGSFDDASADVDYTQPVTVEIGGLSQTFSLAPNTQGTAFSFKDATRSMTVQPKLKGSSRGTFTMKLNKATLGGLIDPNGEIAMHFRATGLPDALGIVKLTNGGYALGKVRGALVAPAFFPSKIGATLSDTKPDILAVTAGFATDGTVPSTLDGLHFALGDELELAIPGSEFTKKGNVFRAAGSVGNGSYTVAVDFSRELITLKTKGLELGALAGPITQISGGSFVSPLPIQVPVQLGASGVKRTY